MDFKEIGQAGLDWICLAQDRGKEQAVLKDEMNIRIP